MVQISSITTVIYDSECKLFLTTKQIEKNTKLRQLWYLLFVLINIPKANLHIPQNIIMTGKMSHFQHQFQNLLSFNSKIIKFCIINDSLRQFSQKYCTYRPAYFGLISGHNYFDKAVIHHCTANFFTTV